MGTENDFFNNFVQRIHSLLGWILFFATTITTVHYLATKVLGLQVAFRHIQSLLSLLVIAPVNRVVPEIVAASKFADFEDAVLPEAAGRVGQNI